MLKGGIKFGVIVFALMFGATASVTAQPHKPHTPPKGVVKKQVTAKKLSAAQLAAVSGALTEMGSARKPSQLDAQSRALLDRAIAALADGKQEAALQSFGELVKGKKLGEAQNLARYVVLRSYATDPVIPGLAAQAHRLSAQRGALAAHRKKLEALLTKSQVKAARHRVPILTLQPTGPAAFSVREVDLEITRDDVVAAITSAKARESELTDGYDTLTRKLQSATDDLVREMLTFSAIVKAFLDTAKGAIQNVK